MSYKKIKYLPIVSIIWLFATAFIGGINYPHYNHITQFISELGANGAPNNLIINYLGLTLTEVFLIIYFVFLLKNYRLNKISRIGIYILLLYCLLLIIGALFPIEYEFSTETYSLSQTIHSIAGGLAYLMGIVGIIVLSIGYKIFSDDNKILIYGLVLSTISIICLTFLIEENELDGLIQRLLEASIYLWIILFSLKFNYVPTNTPPVNIEE